MNYKSTRDSFVSKASASAITMGISEEGGLFVPESLPEITTEELESLTHKNYREVAAVVLSKYLTDFSESEIYDCVRSAYTAEKFESDEIAPISKLSDSAYVLELWHGPTCAFKDMALQILPHLLTRSAKKTLKNKKIAILVATSGDTGKAALEGFRDVDGIKILVFYPEDGVSPMQKLQMKTQRGNNVGVSAIYGNFDDAQSGVKKIFTSTEMKKELSERGYVFSSANSINWGRLVPQVVYYIYAYTRLVRSGEIALGDKINITVPTGNFGNILAAYYAMRMGLPVNKLICASNSNNVLTDFITTGTYDRNRSFYTTISPSMDILISSNLERLLYHLSDGDDKLIAGLMQKLSSEGRYTVPEDIRAKLQSVFCAGYCNEEKTRNTIKSVFEHESYICDPHTAVGIGVYNDYRKKTGDASKTIIASTASPFKFPKSVLDSLRVDTEGRDEFKLAQVLSDISGLDVPDQLRELLTLPVRFDGVCKKEEMSDTVKKMLD